MIRSIHGMRREFQPLHRSCSLRAAQGRASLSLTMISFVSKGVALGVNETLTPTERACAISSKRSCRLMGSPPVNTKTGTFKAAISSIQILPHPRSVPWDCGLAGQMRGSGHRKMLAADGCRLRSREDTANRMKAFTRPIRAALDPLFSVGGARRSARITRLLVQE